MYVPLVGWLADNKFGNYKVLKLGSILSFSIAVTTSLTFLITHSFDASNTAVVVVQLLCNVLSIIGNVTCFATALQLGLDQMPDASAANITSFISWFVFSIISGFWISSSLDTFLDLCQQQEIKHIISLVLPASCMSIILCTVFLFVPKSMIIEPKSTQTLKTMFKVLKFAVKHKAPLNRSAFTYWEEEIPSRLDLGKSKYGGPFTTEQVEDVKTFIRLVIMFIPILIVGLASPLIVNIEIPGIRNEMTDGCRADNLIFNNLDNKLIIVITTIVYEFVIYPLVRNKLPSSLIRIGIALFVILIIKSFYLTGLAVEFTFTHHGNHTELLSASYYETVTSIHVTLGLLNNGVALTFLLNGMLEFVCAQSPYSVRGLLTGCIIFITFTLTAHGDLIFSIISDITRATGTWPRYNVIVCSSVTTGLSLIGLILFCILARRYKRRVRDDEYFAHRVVEEVYDRYLSQVPVRR